MSHSVVIKDAVKKYGSFTALKGANLEVKPGEFFTLLGPSGCGKTTLLRMIAGFNSIDGGAIYFDEKMINNLEAHKRDIGMVFQNYAIFPHLTVWENVAYGLKAKKLPKKQIEERVSEALRLVQIEPLKDRRPNELSGGQQQRVALARAFVIEPSVLLMDEPLSNLDAKLRVQMRTVIKKLQRRLGITTIYVTHDQEEALAISDRIAVMNEGEIIQIGTPEEIYKKPVNAFVASFIGVSNFIKARVMKEKEEAFAVIHNDYKIPIKEMQKGEDVVVSVRPEQLVISDKGIPGNIILSTFLGDFTEYEVSLDNGQTIQINEYTKDSKIIHPDGSRVYCEINIEAVNLYDSTGGEVL
ncbi:ABC transporter ATP-binding protein [Alloiococcus sp. CFN-8]|uniref:ABC transporter ATP-binding protein n=1 Tax=Alloiococcus sp. CFN-8 TaxID=3416081 RepID=UPI003CF8BB45